MNNTSIVLLILFVAVCSAARFPFQLRSKGIKMDAAQKRELCEDPLGMESRLIKDAQITASSQQNGNNAATLGRLNFLAGGGKAGGWSPRWNNVNQWIQIDLVNYTEVTRIATQGRNRRNRFGRLWVTKYKLQYSDDGVTFHYYQLPGRSSPKEFNANQDSDTVVSHQLCPTIFARYIRLDPTAWHGHISMRMELYGCKGLHYNASKSCKAIKQKNRNAESGIYWINPDGNNPTQAYCDQETDGGGWTLVYSYTFTNYRMFMDGSNAVTPRPSWKTNGDVPVSTKAPVSETDYNAMDFNQWKNLGNEFMIKSNINHWIACKVNFGSLVEFRAGGLQCRNIKNVASKCHGFVPDYLIFSDTYGIQYSGPFLARSQTNGYYKTYYFFDTTTRTPSKYWPTHDPCGANGLNQLTNVTNPHGNIYIRE